jgi:hypothetical protein
MTITTPSGFCPKCEFFKNDVSNAVKHKRPGGKPR